MASQQNPISIYGADQEKISRALSSQSKGIAAEDLLIHTMKGDMETSANNPSPSIQKRTIEEKTLTEKQQTSPFLSDTQEKSTEASRGSDKYTDDELPVKPQSYEIKTETPKKPAAILMAPNNGRRINWFLIMAIFSSIVFLVGGAYLWILNKNNNKSTSPETAIEAPTESDVSSGQETTMPENSPAALSASQPNYMQLDLADPAAASVQDQLGKYIQLVKSGNYPNPIEFDVTDMQNNPVPIDTFMEKTNLGLTPAIRAQLGTAYSLFIFNDSGNSRLGLQISSQNDAKLQEELSKEEPSLVKYMRPLLLGLTIPPASGPFASSTYNGAAIRYINFNIGNDISVDYTVFNSKLIVGTSKTTLRSILDSENKPAVPYEQQP